MPTTEELCLAWLARYRELVGASPQAKAPTAVGGALDVTDNKSGAQMTSLEVQAILWGFWQKEPRLLVEGFLKVTGQSFFHPRKSIRAIDRALGALAAADVQARAAATDAVRRAADTWLQAREEDASSRRPGVLGLLPVLELIDTATLAAVIDRPSRAAYTQSQEAEVVERAASGNMASVSKITYTDGRVVAFKKAETEGEMGAASLVNHGVADDHATANLSGRTVATSDLSTLLGLHNVPDTTYTLHGGDVGVAQDWVEGRSSTTSALLPKYSFNDGYEWLDIFPLMGSLVFDCAESDRPLVERGVEAELREAYEAGTIWVAQSGMTHAELPDLTDPSLQKSLADSHLFDLLTGQLDRTPGNFVYGEDDDGHSTAYLIDNDLCFAPDTRLEDDADPARPGYLPGLPDLVDAGTAARFLALMEEDLKALLAAHGMSEAEQDGAVARLEAIQAHLTTLSDAGALVDEWNDDTAAAQLGATNNYLQRVNEETILALRQTPDKASSLEADARTGGTLFAQTVDMADEGEYAGMLAGAMQNPGTMEQLFAQHPDQGTLVLRTATYEQQRSLCDPYVTTDISQDVGRAREAASWVGAMMSPDAPEDDRGDSADQQYGYLLSRLLRGNSSSAAVGPILDTAAGAGRLTPSVVAKVLLGQREELAAAALESGDGHAALEQLANDFNGLFDSLIDGADVETPAGIVQRETLVVSRLLYFQGSAAYNERTGAKVDTQKKTFENTVSRGLGVDVITALIDARDQGNTVAVGAILTAAGFAPVATAAEERSKEQQQVDFVRSTLTDHFT